MKKLIVASLAAGILAAVPISGFAGQTIDATHLDLNGNGCTQCHFSMDINTGLEIVPGDTCGGCHINETGGYSDNSAPYAASHFGFTCQTCHNPHVSLEFGEGTTPLVAGSISNAVTSGSDLILTYSLGATPGAWSANPASWAAKTKTDRGLILWETDGTDNYSFKVSAADNTTITVEGGVPAGLALGDLQTTFELHYGQLIAKAVDANTSTYRDANATTAAVDFPSMGTTGTTAGNMFVNETGNGICQRCHNGTLHWTNSASNDGHNVDAPCTECHLHDSKLAPVYAFGIDTSVCVTCHPSYPEPPASGAHAVHASPTTGYAMACATCHKGGMNDQMGYIQYDGKVQIGINLIGRNNFSGLHTNYDGVSGTFPDAKDYGTDYEGKNDSTVTIGGTMTCSNVYCHSTGQASELACLTGEIQGKTGASLAWDGSDGGDSDGNKCNNCHSQTYPTTNTNLHFRHVTAYGLMCANCHADTAANDGTIINKANHVNGSIEVKQGGIYNYNGQDLSLSDYATNPPFTYDTATKDCSGVYCHATRTWGDEPATCVVDASNANTVATNEGVSNTPPVYTAATPTCYNVSANTYVSQDSSYDPDYIDAFKAAAFGGHTGGTMMYEFKWYGFAGQAFNTIPVTDVSNPQAMSSMSYDETYLNSGAARGDLVYTRYWMNDNSGVVTRVAGGAWHMCETGAYDVNQNSLPIVSVVPEIADPSTLRLIDNTVDPDWDTTPANPLWTGVDKNATNGCGNNGGDAYVTYKWYDNKPNHKTILMQPYRETPQGLVVTHTYTNLATTGGAAWYLLEIYDNKSLDCGTTTDLSNVTKTAWAGIQLY